MSGSPEIELRIVPVSLSAVNHARLRFVLLLIAALLAARIGGVHVHLHSGDHTAPSEVHLVDAGLHDEHHGDAAPHAGVEVQIAGAIAKIGKLGFDLPMLFAALLLGLLILFSAHIGIPRRAEAFVPRTSRYRLPPLRGPPR